MGEEPLLVLESEDAIRKTAQKIGFTERRSFAFDGNSDYTPFIEALSDLSLFGEKQLLEVRLLNGNPGLKTGLKALEKLKTLEVGGNTLVMLCLPELDWQKRKSKWFTELSKHAIVVNASAITRNQLPTWIRDRFISQNQNPTDEVIHFIANRTEGNLLACEQEIRKLALFAPQGDLELSVVLDAVSNVSHYTPDDLSLAILQQDVVRITRILDQLKAENVLIPSFLWILVEDIKVVIKLKHYYEGRLTLVTDRSYKFSQTQKKYALEKLAKKASMKRLEATLERYVDVDKISKGIFISNRDNDPWLELKAAALLLVSR